MELQNVNQQEFSLSRLPDPVCGLDYIHAEFKERVTVISKNNADGIVYIRHSAKQGNDCKIKNVIWPLAEFLDQFIRLDEYEKKQRSLF